MTVTVTAAPAEGIMTTVALYGPGLKAVTSTLKVAGEDAWEVSLPVVGVTVNHVEDGVPTVHVNVSPPVFCIVMGCAAGLFPTVVVNVRLFALSVIWGGAMLMVIGTVDGLPATARLVIGSIALIITLVVNVEPPGTPVALTITLTVALVPPARFVPAPAESETKPGAPAPSTAVQFNGSPPVLAMVIG